MVFVVDGEKNRIFLGQIKGKCTGHFGMGGWKQDFEGVQEPAITLIHISTQAKTLLCLSPALQHLISVDPSQQTAPCSSTSLTQKNRSPYSQTYQTHSSKTLRLFPWLGMRATSFIPTQFPVIPGGRVGIPVHE